MSLSDEPRERLFLALWPGVTIKKSLSELQGKIAKQCHCRLIPTNNVHITLQFIGAIPVSLRQSLVLKLRSVRCHEINIRLDQINLNRRSHIIWLHGDVSPGLAALVDQVRMVISGLDLPLEQRPFLLHMTLARKLTKCHGSLPEFEPLNWRCKEFVLLRSQTFQSGAQYEVVESFPLYAVNRDTENRHEPGGGGSI